jgi:glycosyltransferase involved in cell wall biosynthesis
MRVGIDASNIRAGGGLTHLVELLGALDPERDGVEQVTVWGGRPTLARLPKAPWLHAAREPLLDGSILRRIYWQREKLSRLAKRCCDVLLVPGGTHAGSFRPFVTMSQNMLPFEASERRRYGLSWDRLRLRLLESSQTATFRQAAGVIFLTEAARQAVERRTGLLPGQVAVIPHGVNDSFNCPPREQRSLSFYSWSDPFKLLYVSIVDVYKHQWRVVEAVAELRRQGLPVVVDLIGPAYPRALSRLREAIKRLDPKEEFISYRGALPHSELAEYYHRADGFIFASSCENLPNILIEAMASGLPIACSDRGPMPEVLGEGGVYFDPEVPASMAETLSLLIRDSALRERCAALAYGRAQSYTWRRCATETFSFLRAVVQGAERETEVIRLPQPIMRRAKSN